MILALIDSRSSKYFWALLWTFILCLQLWFLLNDITFLKQPSLPASNVFQGVPLADLKTIQNTVRFQNPSDVLWLETTVGQKLYEGQTLLTSDQSAAKIEFEPGNFLEIGPNSLIQIQRLKKGSDSELTLELLRGSLKGSLKGKSNHGLRLKNKSLEAQVSNQSSFEIVSSNDPTKTSAILVTEGRANVLSGQQNQQVQAGELLQIKDGTIAKEKSSLTQLTQTITPDAVTRFEPKLIVDTPTPPPAEVKKAADFLRPPSKVKRPVFRRKTKKQSSLRLWDYFIRSAQADEPAAIEYRRESWEIDLEWEAVPNAQGYLIQVARTRAFEHFHANERVNTNKYVWNYEPGMENSKGRVFYRIATINADGKTGAFSPPVSLPIPVELVKKKPEPAPETKTVQKTVAKTDPNLAKPTAKKWLKLSIGTEMSQISQTTQTQLLKEVTVTPYMHERLYGSYLWNSSDSPRGEQKFKLLEIDIRLESFKGAKGSSQPVVKPWSAEISGYKLKYAKPWFWGYGLNLTRHYRFVKAGPRAVEGSGAFGLGPSVAALLFNKPIVDWTPTNLGAQLSVPITGLFLTSGYGPQAALWSEWCVYKPTSGWIGLQTELDGHYLIWKEPKDSKVSRFSFSLNATWHSAF